MTAIYFNGYCWQEVGSAVMSIIHGEVRLFGYADDKHGLGVAGGSGSHQMAGLEAEVLGWVPAGGDDLAASNGEPDSLTQALFGQVTATIGRGTGLYSVGLPGYPWGLRSRVCGFGLPTIIPHHMIPRK